MKVCINKVIKRAGVYEEIDFFLVIVFIAGGMGRKLLLFFLLSIEAYCIYVFCINRERSMLKRKHHQNILISSLVKGVLYSFIKIKKM